MESALAHKCHAAQMPVGANITSAQRSDSEPAANEPASQSLSYPISCGAMTRFATFAVKRRIEQVVARMLGGTNFCSRPKTGPI